MRVVWGDDGLRRHYGSARTLRPGFPLASAVAAREHADPVPRVVERDGVELPRRLELRLDAAARIADVGAVRAAVHHPARLQPRVLLREYARQSLAGWRA